jgi:foldase protein PrsA
MAKAKKQSVPEETPIVTQTTQNNRLYWILGAVALLLGLGYALRNQFVVATVNGQLITRSEYVSAMEAQGGKQVLEQLILEKLIKEEASKKNLSVPQEDIDTQIESIEQSLSAQGQELNTALEERGMTREQLADQIRVSKYMELLAGESVEVTDEEVEAYISENKEMLKNFDDKEELENMVREQLTQSKSQEASQSVIEKLQANAEIRYW